MPHQMKHLLLFGLLLASGVYAAAEEYVLTTTYPSPRGVYQEIRTTSNAFLATQGGSVGIGTATPSSKLEVIGGQLRVLDAPWDNVFQTTRVANWIRNQAPGILVDADSDYVFLGLKHEGANRNDPVIGWGDDAAENGSPPADDALRFVHYTNVANVPTDLERMRIDAAGNVGIGTATPNTAPSPANGATKGNLDVNDIYLRASNRWASALSAPPVCVFCHGGCGGSWPNQAGIIGDEIADGGNIGGAFHYVGRGASCGGASSVYDSGAGGDVDPVISGGVYLCCR